VTQGQFEFGIHKDPNLKDVVSKYVNPFNKEKQQSYSQLQVKTK
jgi:hypothetical protein